jgi:hypothetical protein
MRETSTYTTYTVTPAGRPQDRQRHQLLADAIRAWRLGPDRKKAVLVVEPWKAQAPARMAG